MHSGFSFPSSTWPSFLLSLKQNSIRRDILCGENEIVPRQWENLSNYEMLSDVLIPKLSCGRWSQLPNPRSNQGADSAVNVIVPIVIILLQLSAPVAFISSPRYWSNSGKFSIWSCDAGPSPSPKICLGNSHFPWITAELFGLRETVHCWRNVLDWRDFWPLWANRK